MDNLSLTLTAISDPTRRAILNRLRQGPQSVNALTEPFQLSQQAISKHLAYLERAQLIEKHKKGRLSICTLNPQPFQEIAAWVEPYRKHWEQAVDRLEVFLKDIQEAQDEE